MNKDREKAIKLYWKIAKERCPFHEEEIVNGFLEGFINCAVYLLPQIVELEKACNETQELLDKQIEATYKLDKELNETVAILQDSNGHLAKDRDYKVSVICKRNKLIDELKAENKKAKNLLNEFMRISKASDEDFEHDYSELIKETDQFITGF